MGDLQEPGNNNIHRSATTSWRPHLPYRFEYVRGLGATGVLDYKDEHMVPKLKGLGPYELVMTASSDPKGANAISVLQPGGGYLHLPA